MANCITVEDGETHQLLPEVDPGELTVQLARALEGGDSVTVGIEPPPGQELAALTVGQSAACVLVTTDAG